MKELTATLMLRQFNSTRAPLRQQLRLGRETVMRQRSHRLAIVAAGIIPAFADHAGIADMEQGNGRRRNGGKAGARR